MSISKIAKGAGYAGAIIGTGVDIYRVSEGGDPGIAMENVLFTGIGLKGGWPGAIISTLYFGLNTYYSGGANQAAYDFSKSWSKQAKLWGQIKMGQGGL